MSGGTNIPPRPGITRPLRSKKTPGSAIGFNQVGSTLSSAQRGGVNSSQTKLRDISGPRVSFMNQDTRFASGGSRDELEGIA